MDNELKNKFNQYNIYNERLIGVKISDISGEYKYFAKPNSHVSPHEIYKKLFQLEELIEQNKIIIL